MYQKGHKLLHFLACYNCFLDTGTVPIESAPHPFKHYNSRPWLQTAQPFPRASFCLLHNIGGEVKAIHLHQSDGVSILRL